MAWGYALQNLGGLMTQKATDDKQSAAEEAERLLDEKNKKLAAQTKRAEDQFHGIRDKYLRGIENDNERRIEEARIWDAYVKDPVALISELATKTKTKVGKIKAAEALKQNEINAETNQGQPGGGSMLDNLLERGSAFAETAANPDRWINPAKAIPGARSDAEKQADASNVQDQAFNPAPKNVLGEGAAHQTSPTLDPKALVPGGASPTPSRLPTKAATRAAVEAEREGDGTKERPLVVKKVGDSFVPEPAKDQWYIDPRDGVKKQKD